MSGRADSRRARTVGRAPRHVFDADAKRAFLRAFAKGLTVEAAAEAAGFSISPVYYARKRDAEFAAEWERIAGEIVPCLIRPNNKRRLQKRTNRRVRFTEARRELFLSHFAGTCDLKASADAAGVSKDCVYKTRLHDPDFAALCEIALEQGYLRLEAEAVAQRLKAQQRLAEAMEKGIEATGEVAEEFERVMKLLTRWQRRWDGVRGRTIAPEHRRKWTVDEAIEALEAKLRAMGIPIGPLPPEEGDEEDLA